jgi:3-hydroxyacyl-CoA dehydrogenase
MPIRKVAVLGAGTMGSGIAAHIANAGVPVALLDLGDSAHAAIARMTAPPSCLMTKQASRLVTPGSLQDELDLAADADWIIEAVIEDLGVKRRIYRRLDELRRPGSIVSSNTSTMPLSQLVAGAPDSLVPDFLISHFFNPPRAMRLLELVAGPSTRPAAVETITQFAHRGLGKTVVRCNDTPAFIANRVGCFWIACSVADTIACGLTVEEADAVLGEPLGVPKTGVFGLLDLVGIPLYTDLSASLERLLEPDDPWRAIPGHTELCARMAAAGLTGRASTRGFYSYKTSAKLALDLASLAYRPAREMRPLDVAGLRGLVERSGPYGQLARMVLTKTIAYASRLVPEVSDSVSQIDLAMQLGFGWRRGPFALADELDPAWVAEQLPQADVPACLAAAARAGSFLGSSDEAEAAA